MQMESVINNVNAEKQKLLGCIKRARSISAEDLNTIGLNDVELRPYQLDGVQWLIGHFTAQLGCIMADEMGLGKTCQTIALLTYVYGHDPNTGLKKSLVVCPLSVLSNWQNELKRFAPKLKFLAYAGNQDKRAELQHDIQKNSDIQLVLTTYEMCMKDEGFFGSFDWNVLVVDEGHRLKNRQSMLHQYLIKMSFTNRLLLTGTPVQNNLEELYALLCFVAPKVFRHRHAEHFVEMFRDVGKNSSKRATELKELIEPFILRRTKSEVLKDLPRLSEVVLYHGITALQKKYYKAILTNDIDAFDAPGKMHKTRLLNVLMQLRKCVAHPYLFDGVEPEPFELGNHLVEASGKLLIVDQLLSYLKTHGHKVLLFSQMTHILDILQDYLTYRGYSYERLDGSVRAEERFLAINNFNNDADTFVFLLSTKAGGQGVNLTSADTVILFDSDFNPQNDLQAAARAHRIGQKRNVKVIRLIGRSTVEEIILRRAEDKLRLTEAVMSSAGGENSDENFKVENIIKFGLDKLFANDESSIEDVDFTAILGETVDGEWQLDRAAPATSSEEDDETDDEATGNSDEIHNMYVFEGKDYSKEPSAADQQAFQQLSDGIKAAQLSAEAEPGARSRRKKQTNFYHVSLPDQTSRRTKQTLTPEEKEARRIQRAEKAAQKAREEEEAEIKRMQAKKAKRKELWASNNYNSCGVELPDDADNSDSDKGSVVNDDDVLSDDEDAGEKQKSIHYVIGDVMKPQQTENKDAIIVHCVDDSGRWGQGGLFTQINNRSLQPQEQYKLAGTMKDLALADVHIVPIDDIRKRQNGKDMVALMVTQHRDKNNVLSGIKMSALTTALQKVSYVARKSHATVHMPRIGHNTPGFNWYGTERLIQKYLAARGVPTYVYYYPRQSAAKRKRDDEKQGSQSTSSLSSTSLAKRSRDESPSSSRTSVPLPDFLTDVSIHFLDSVPKDVVKSLSRHIIAYNGNVHANLESDTTFVVVADDDNMLTAKELKLLQPDATSDMQCITIKQFKDFLVTGQKPIVVNAH